MNNRALKKVTLFNKRAAVWLYDLEQYTNQQIQIRPSKNSWSLSELYDHIIKVALTAQIPHYKKSLTKERKLGTPKNILGYVLFNIGYLPKTKIVMEKFPKELVVKFTPERKNKEELIIDFRVFIKEVNDLKSTLLTTNSKDRHYHPKFGTINAVDWFSLLEIHLRHHERQKKRIIEALTLANG